MLGLGFKNESQYSNSSVNKRKYLLKKYYLGVSEQLKIVSSSHK